MAMSLPARYNEALRNVPAPGGGGCHGAILGCANLGVLAGIPSEAIFQDLRGSIPSGSRKVSDGEIHDAIHKALADHSGATYTPRPRPAPAVNNGKGALQKIIGQGKISNEADLWEASPIRLWEAP
jgi:hypothetical protein